MSDQTRDRIYKAGIIVFIIAVGVAVAFGVIDAGSGDRIVALVISIVAPVLGIGVSGLAKKHIRATTTQTVVAVQDVIDQLTTGGDGVHAATHVDAAKAARARAEAQAR